MTTTSQFGGGQKSSVAAPEFEAGRAQLQDILDQHVETLMAFREHCEVRDVDLLTSKNRWRRLPDAEVNNSIKGLHGRMRTLIQEVADQIEEGNYRSGEQAIREMQISKEERVRATRLIGADRAMQTSCTSLKVAVEVFSRMNEWIVERIESGDDLLPDEERKLVLSNAILVFELTDFCIGFISDFSTDGVREIKDLHKRMLGFNSESRAEHNRLRKQAASKSIEPSLSERVLTEIENREHALESLEKEWDDYLDGIGAMSGQIDAFAKKIPGLKLIRDNAKAQINVLSAISVLQLVRNNIDSIQAVIDQLEDVHLVALSPDRVKRLLRVDVGPTKNITETAE